MLWEMLKHKKGALNENDFRDIDWIEVAQRLSGYHSDNLALHLILHALQDPTQYR